MKCPKCGYNIPRKKLASDMGKKGGKVSSNAKRQAAKDREARKRCEKTEGYAKFDSGTLPVKY